MSTTQPRCLGSSWSSRASAKRFFNERTQDCRRESMTAIKKRLRVGVVFGGPSGEHEVSVASAASVIRALDPEQYEAVPIGISKDGRWLVGSGSLKKLGGGLKYGEPGGLPPAPP